MVSSTNNTTEPIEKQLWKAADKLHKNIDAADYRHVVLGLIFLPNISDAVGEYTQKATKGRRGITQRIGMNTKPRMCSLYRFSPAGLIARREQNCRSLARIWTRLWMSSSEIIPL